MKQILFTLTLTGLVCNAYAQNVGIGTSSPSASAKLEISSTNSGILIPRIALNNINDGAAPIATPATGVLVYNTNAATVGGSGAGFYYWNGTAWAKLQDSASNDWRLTGNAGTSAATNFVGTTDAVDLVIRTNNTEKMRVMSGGNVGIGINNPTQKLDVQGGNARINNTFIGDVGHGAGWAGMAHQNQVSTTAYSLLASTDGSHTFINKQNTGNGHIGFRVANNDVAVITNAGNMGIGTTSPAYRLDLANGTFGFGNSNVRTETRANAGLQGNAGAQSGFFETDAPVNYPTGASGWWHLIDSRHSNNGNNYALQIAGSFFDQELWFRKTNGSATTAWSRLLSSTNLNTYGWTILGNSGTSSATNFVGTIDAVDFVTRTSNVERMRVTAAGNVGIGTASPGESFSVYKANANWQGRFSNSNGAGADVYLAHGGGYGMHIRGWNANDAVYTLEMYNVTSRTNVFYNSGRVGLGLINNVGVGTETPAAKLHVVGGSIRPQTGNDAVSGIYFTPNPGGGGGDEAYIRHYVEGGENTKMVIANVNDPDDDIAFVTGLTNAERMNISGNGSIRIEKGVLFDCNDCGATNTIDGNQNWGDLIIQGRVLSTNSNLHLSPPNGNRVIISSDYRAAGGAVGTSGLDITDGGIRMRKNYRWINRYGSTGGFGWGSQTHNLGNWDFCAVGHVGFRNTNSATDEDDDVQCAVYPQAHAGPGEGDQWDANFTYQYNARPLWYMYLEGYADTNATNCAASCINFD